MKLRSLIIAGIACAIPDFAFADDQAKCVNEMGSRLQALNGQMRTGAVKNVSLNSSGTTLFISGLITPDTLTQFNAIPAEQKKKIRAVVLNSPGGKLDVGLKIGEWIENNPAKLKVLVPDNGICASACTEMFRCAENGSAGTNSLFLFHPASMPDDGKAALGKFFGGNQALGSMAGDLMAAYGTVRSKNTGCAKSIQSEGARKLDAAVLRGQEICYSGRQLRDSFKGFLDELQGPGLLEEGTPAGR